MMKRWSGIVVLVVSVLGAVVWSTETHGTVQPAHEALEHEALEHTHGPRHGGQFGDADDQYHYEVLVEAPNRLVVYVNDELNRPLNVRALHGRWTINPDDAHPQTGALSPFADGAYFTAQLPAVADPLDLEIAVLKDHQWVALEFSVPVPFVSAKR